MTNSKNGYGFIHGVSMRLVRKTADGSMATVSVPGAFRFQVPADSLFDSADANGNLIPNHVNVRLDKDAEYAITVAGDDGNFSKDIRTGKQIINAWAASKREYASANGGKVYLNGVSPKLVRESKVKMKDGRFMTSVSIADPDSVPADGKSTGYGSFLVSPDAVTPCKTGDKVNVYLGYESKAIPSYQIRTGESTFEKIARTAGEIKAIFDANIAAYKAGMAAAV